jgi:hypothetical protein
MTEPMLTVKNLVKHFPVREYKGVFPTTLQTRAVDGISSPVCWSPATVRSSSRASTYLT